MAAGIVIAVAIGIPLILMIFMLILHYDGTGNLIPCIAWPAHGYPLAEDEAAAANRPITLKISGSGRGRRSEAEGAGRKRDGLP